MTRVRVRGFQIFADRHGKLRCYHRRTRIAVDLEKAPIGSAAFLAECQRIGALAKPDPEPKPGTLGRLVAAYKASRDFSDLAPRTRADYSRCFDYLRPIADTPLIQFTRPLVVKIRDKAADRRGRRWGNYVRAVLSVLFGWGAERGFLADNPARGVKAIGRARDAPRANRPWTDDERQAVLTGAPPHLAAGIALMLNTGLDPTDALRLRRDQVDGLWITGVRGKTREPVSIPMARALAEALAAAPAHDAVTVLASSKGQPWTLSGFQSSWARVRKKLQDAKAIAPGLTLKGCRHTVATVLREEGCDERTIADLLGQKTPAMARHYSNRADLRNKNQKTGQILSLAYDARTKVVKPGGEKCQTDKKET